jgi:hypothetical protein
MIKTKELMLGNWVLAGAKTQFPMQVVGVFDDVAYLDFEGNEGDVWEEKEEDMLPVPLTEKFFIRNGFLKKKDKISEYYTSPDGRVFIRFRKGISVLVILPLSTARVGARNRIKYVHELQNLLTLAGIEMEFKI